MTHVATPTERHASSNYLPIPLQFKIATLLSKKTHPSFAPTYARLKHFLQCASTTNVLMCVRKQWRKTMRLEVRMHGRSERSKRRQSKLNLPHVRERQKSKRWSVFKKILKLCRSFKIRSCKAFFSKPRVIRKRYRNT